MTARRPPAIATAPGENIISAPLDAVALQRALERAVERNMGEGGGILRIESTATPLAWEGACGRLAADSSAIHPTSAFEIASVTKMFVAVSVLRLAEEGRIDLDAPFSRYVVGPGTHGLLKVRGRDQTASLTVRQLLGHRSGLPDYWTDPPYVGRGPAENAFLVEFLRDPQHFWQPREIVAYLPRLTAVGAPGGGYHYADSNYVLLGLMIEQITGHPLHQHVRVTLLQPLGMTRTYWPYYESPPPGVEIAHRYEGKLDLHGQRRQSADWGGGGLVSTTADLALFARALFGGHLLQRPASWKAMSEWQRTDQEEVDYGLGLFRVRLSGVAREELWGHDGHGNAFLYYSPRRQLLWIGTLNQTDNSWWDMIEPFLRGATPATSAMAPAPQH